MQRSFDADGIFNPLKRDKSRRTVKLTLQTVEALKLHRKCQYKERLRAAKWEDHGPVFPNRVGRPMDHNNQYHRDFKSLLKRAGLWSENKDKRFAFHSLRHTCATLLLSMNVNPKIVHEIVGRATITRTMATYSHVLPGMGDVATTALEEELG